MGPDRKGHTGSSTLSQDQSIIRTEDLRLAAGHSLFYDNRKCAALDFESCMSTAVHETPDAQVSLKELPSLSHVDISRFHYHLTCRMKHLISPSCYVLLMCLDNSAANATDELF